MLVKNKKGTHIYWVPRGCPASINTNNKNRLRTEYLRGKEKMFSALWLHLTQHTLINTTPPDSTWNGIECELSVPSFTLTITRVLFKVIFISVNKSIITVHQWGFPDGASGKEPTCQWRRQEIQVQSLSWEDPLEEDTATTPVFLTGESHGQRSLVGYGPQVPKELDMTEWQSTAQHSSSSHPPVGEIKTQRS